MSYNIPVKVPPRWTKAVDVMCGFTDTSGRELCSIAQGAKGGENNASIGAWSISDEEEETYFPDFSLELWCASIKLNINKNSLRMEFLLKVINF